MMAEPKIRDNERHLKYHALKEGSNIACSAKRIPADTERNAIFHRALTGLALASSDSSVPFFRRNERIKPIKLNDRMGSNDQNRRFPDTSFFSLISTDVFSSDDFRGMENEGEMLSDSLSIRTTGIPSFKGLADTESILSVNSFF